MSLSSSDPFKTCMLVLLWTDYNLLTVGFIGCSQEKFRVSEENEKRRMGLIRACVPQTLKHLQHIHYYTLNMLHCDTHKFKLTLKHRVVVQCKNDHRGEGLTSYTSVMSWTEAGTGNCLSACFARTGQKHSWRTDFR